MIDKETPIFNENKLRQEINKSVRKEIEKYKGELGKLWGYLWGYPNQLHERLKIVEAEVEQMKFKLNQKPHSAGGVLPAKNGRAGGRN